MDGAAKRVALSPQRLPLNPGTADEPGVHPSGRPRRTVHHDPRGSRADSATQEPLVARKNCSARRNPGRPGKEGLGAWERAGEGVKPYGATRPIQAPAQARPQATGENASANTRATGAASPNTSSVIRRASPAASAGSSNVGTLDALATK
jgi:hypothetical protein